MQDANALMIDLSSGDQSKLRHLEVVMDTTDSEYIGHHTLLLYLFYDVFNIITFICQESCFDASHHCSILCNDALQPNLSLPPDVCSLSTIIMYQVYHAIYLLTLPVS